MPNISEINGYLINADTASYAVTASFLSGSVTSASYAATASFVATASWALTSSLATLATTADTAKTVITIANTTNATFYPTFVDSNNTPTAASEVVYTSDRFTFNPSTRVLTISGGIIALGATITGSLNVTGSLAVIGAITSSIFSGSSFTGSLFGTASWAVSASQAISASRATTSSFAISASWAPSVASNPFPFTGSALITGSLGVTGSTSIRGSFIQGSASSAAGLFAHAQGMFTTANGDYSHAEGFLAATLGTYSHAEGQGTTTIGFYSHAEGQSTTTQGDNSHAEGEGTLAIGIASHTEGQFTTASADYSHTEGNSTQTVSTYQHAQGQFNLPTSGSGAFIIGNGTADNARSNLVFASGSQFQITGSLNVSGSSIITSALTVGTSSLGSTENTLVVGLPPAGGTGEGGQILLQASGGLYTTASMIDNYQNKFRVLRGTNAGSDAFKLQLDMHTGQMQLPNYNSATAFTGSEVAMLGVDNNGNILTTTVPGAVLTNNYVGAGFTNPIVTYMPFGTTTVSGNESQRQVASPVAGTIKNFYLRTNNTAPATSYTTWTIRVNGVATGITLVVSGGQAAAKYSNTTNSASIAIGDEISLQVSTSVANSPQVNQYSLGIYVS